MGAPGAFRRHRPRRARAGLPTTGGKRAPGQGRHSSLTPVLARAGLPSRLRESVYTAGTADLRENTYPARTADLRENTYPAGTTTLHENAHPSRTTDLRESTYPGKIPGLRENASPSGAAATP
ncbi:hypothetical protein GCM10022252_28810 [Streptosporangium oxazolinicum]|uniref:Uncharacterized protein n=1 Tax=Streptosporangium oxazolinicum TaxID=909287 RepID=A0ABP8AUN9_9ACTN